MSKSCKKCGATLVQTCPVDEEEFCAKRKITLCPQCDYVEMEDEYPAGCNHPKAEDK